MSRHEAYKKLAKPALAEFAGSVAKNMIEKPGYEGAVALVHSLDDLTAQLEEAIEVARRKGATKAAPRDALAQKVIETLDQIVRWLADNDKGDPLWRYHAGFSTHRTARRGKESLQSPFGMKITRLKPGAVRVAFRMPSPKQVLLNVLSYSMDNGETWRTGSHGNSRHITLENLPLMQSLVFRVFSLARPNRQSEPILSPEMFLF